MSRDSLFPCLPEPATLELPDLTPSSDPRTVKEYRLLAWPELPAEYKRTGHRRALTEMSSRHLSLGQLAEVSGLRKSEARALIELLDSRGFIEERDMSAPDSFFDSMRQRGWLRRAKTKPAPGTVRR